MSIGHRHHHEPSEDHLAELAHIRAQPWFREWWSIPFKVEHDWDIPFLGGSSTDLKRVYVHRLVWPAIVEHRLLPGLIAHERVEAILERTGKSYADAHEMATCAENEVYRRQGRNSKDVEKLYPKLLDMTEGAPVFRVPDDLVLQPYLYPPVDESLVARMRAAMVPMKHAA